MEIKLFYCSFCEYKTKRNYDLNRHEIARHSKNILNEYKEANNILLEKNNIHSEDINNNKANDNYICKKCNKSYKTKKSFINHDEKCIGLSILTCPKCMKTFSHVNNKNKHIKKNNCKAKSIIHYNKENNNNIVINNIINNNIVNNNIVNNNIVNNNIVNNNNIIINNYGSERIDYITFEDIMNILLKGGNNIVPRYIEFKHFNDNFPENKNIKYEKNNRCLIRENGEWKYTNIEHLSNKLINKNSYELSEYYNNKKNNIEERIKDIDLIEFIYSRLNYLDLSINKNIYKDIKKEIKNIIKSTLLI